MGISVTDLSRSAQRQVLKKVIGARESKYKNRKTEKETPSGKVIRFDSKKEADRYIALLALQKAGKIRGLKLQADFTLKEAFTDPRDGKRVKAMKYRADFVYQERHGGEWHTVIEDVKGVETDVFKMKERLMREKGYVIRKT